MAWTMEGADEACATASAAAERAEQKVAQAAEISGPATMAQLESELAMAWAAVAQALMLRAQVMIALQLMPSKVQT